MKAIQKNITIIIWVCSLLITFVANRNGYDAEVTIFITSTMFGISAISTVLYFIPMKDRIKAILVLALLGLGCQGVSILLGGNSGTFMTSFIVLGVATLYFDPFIILVYSSIYVPVAVISFIVNPDFIVGPVSPHLMGVFELVAYAVVSICCYIGTREGSKLMKKSANDEQEAQEKAEIIQQISTSANQDAISLYENIVSSDETVGMLSEKANIVNENVENLKNSECDTMDLLQKLSERIDRSTKWIEENYELVNSLEDNFRNAITKVEESMEFKDNASDSLQEILATIQNAVDCIVRSEKQTSEISNIITDMEAIASRTNMLATNASIEAARVGEKGHGFQIVAEQIKVLSVQSRDASEKIRRILDKIAQALTTTESKVNQGLAATDFGIGNLNYIGNGIETIHMYSKQSQATLNKEVEVFEKLKEEFASMVHEVTRNMETAKMNIDEIHVVANAVQSQTNRTELVSKHLKEMEELSNQIKHHFA